MRPPLAPFLGAALLIGSVLAGTTLSSSAAAAPAAADGADASQHFEAGARAFDEHRLADAAVEFERAYELSPAWQVLFNLGTVYAALGRAVEAVDTLELYLEQGGRAIGGDRRLEVEAELVRQREKIGTFDLRVLDAGADVRIDTKAYGQAPLAGPVRLTAGAHVLDVTLAGHTPEQREFTIVGEQVEQLVLALRPAAAPAALAYAELPPSTALASAASSSDRHGRGDVQRVLGYAIGGAGLGTGVVGAFVIAAGQAKHFDAVNAARANAWPRAERLEERADELKQRGLLIAVIGAGALLGGSVLLLSAPRDAGPIASLEVDPWLSASVGGLSMKGSW